MHVEIDIVQRRHRAEMLRDAAQAEHQFAFVTLLLGPVHSSIILGTSERHLEQCPAAYWRPDGISRLWGDAELLAAFSIAARTELLGRVDFLVDDLRLQVLCRDHSRNEELGGRI